MTARAIDKDTFAREWADWHRLHEENLASPNGWLTITGLHWLGPERHRIDRAPGLWSPARTGSPWCSPAMIPATSWWTATRYAASTRSPHPRARRHQRGLG